MTYQGSEDPDTRASQNHSFIAVNPIACRAYPDEKTIECANHGKGIARKLGAEVIFGHKRDDEDHSHEFCDVCLDVMAFQLKDLGLPRAKGAKTDPRANGNTLAEAVCCTTTAYTCAYEDRKVLCTTCHQPEEDGINIVWCWGEIDFCRDCADAFAYQLTDLGYGKRRPIK